ncbi:MAG: 5-formyltetrahydrofolate cyclo-ligase [Eubacterium sp.]|nr:5-formyltetrahydrofolate cyclo-ligase [Eubacterium sp.]
MLKGRRGGDFLKETSGVQKDLRASKLEARGALAEERVRELSRAVSQAVMGLPEFAAENVLYSYCPIRNEVDIMPVNLRALERGKRVYLPKTSGDDMAFYQYSEDTGLSPGPFGVPEPDTAEIYDGSLGIMIVPGVVFSREGFRIGFGKGYYDRYLDAHPMIVTVGVAYEFQMEDAFPVKNSDAPIDIIVTEENVYRN